MQTRAVRLYGAMDLRLERMEIGDIKDDEILASVICNSLCMSDYKIAYLGENHKKVPRDIHENPIILGHEMSGNLLKVGKRWQHTFKEGQRYCVQPMLNLPGCTNILGYTYHDFGGDATYVKIPNEVMEAGCLIPYDGPYYYGSLAEPMSCIIGAFHSNYHSEPLVYSHEMGLKKGGRLAILGGAGPMGLGAVDYALHGPYKPSLLYVTDIDEQRLQRAREIFSIEKARKEGVTLRFLNAPSTQELLEETGGFDDVFVMNSVVPLVEQAGDILAQDGCLNFFSGPTDKEFGAKFNFYKVHYYQTHVVGTSGGSKEDMKEALLLASKGKIDSTAMVTHIGGLNCAAEAIKALPALGGGKKLIYNHIDLPLTAIGDFAELGNSNPVFCKLDELCKKNRGLWSKEAEDYLLQNYNDTI